MNSGIKAALLSGLVFPGLGQIYLKRSLRGFIMMVLVLAGLIIIVSMTISAAMEGLNTIQAQGGIVDMNALSNLAAAEAAQKDSYYNIIFLLIAACWIFSVIDAYRMGKRKDVDTSDSTVVQ